MAVQTFLMITVILEHILFDSNIVTDELTGTVADINIDDIAEHANDDDLLNGRISEEEINKSTNFF